MDIKKWHVHGHLQLRHIHWEIIPIKQHVCIMSLLGGSFPSELKIAKVVPILKSGDIMKFTNYRPVSILPVLSKVLERLVYNRLLIFIDKYKILYLYQFGFRQKHSTFMALSSFIDRITEYTVNGEYSIGVFLDFSQAFDTINHDILFMKLHHYGIRGVSLLWFKSYISNRLQYVPYNHFNSTLQKITCGVPQGSILGPLLLYARLKNGTYYAMAMSVRLSVRPSVRPRFPDFSSTCFEISIWNLVYTFSRWHDMSSLSCITIGSLWPSLQPKVGQTYFLQSWPHKSR